MSELLYRSFVPDLEIRSTAKGGDGRTVDGICVPFGKAMRISSDLTEQFARGSFNHQIKAAHRVKFARGHLSLGGILIGRAGELRDDASGLWGSFRVSKTLTGDETLALIEDGALDELSVGFYERKGGNRTLPDGTLERTRVDLFEVAAVEFGAYGQGAKIKGVRTAEQMAAELDEQGGEGRDRARRAAVLLASVPLLSLDALLGDTLAG